MIKNVISKHKTKGMIDEFDGCVIELIASFLDEHQKIVMALSCKKIFNILYSKHLVSVCNDKIKEISLNKAKTHKYITRIGYDGVVYGECEVCMQIGLLYESVVTHYTHYNTRELKEKYVCLERCKCLCILCGSNILSQNFNGFFEPIMCPSCYLRRLHSTAPN
jgi:hypothetical protein